eukprot:SAG11_NODE_1650_length_4510_cov_6.795738_7_plen_117_part_00
MALRRTPKNETEVWARELADGDMAVGLLNKGGGSQGSAAVDNCKWKVLTGGYNESCGGESGNSGHMEIHSLEDAKKKWYAALCPTTATPFFPAFQSAQKSLLGVRVYGCGSKNSVA